MYNSEYKERYLDQLSIADTSKDTIKKQLAKAEFYESDINIDLCNFNTKEIIEYYKLIGTPSLDLLMVLNNTYMNYTYYCLSNGLVEDAQNHYAEFDNKLLSSCINDGKKNQKIITREQLDSIIDMLRNPSDAFLIQAIFEGICGKYFFDLYHATMSQITPDHIMHCSSGRSLPISDTLYDLAKASSEEYTYYCYTENGEETVRPFDPEDEHIIKRYLNAQPDPPPVNINQRMLAKLQRIRSFSGYPYLVSKSLNESGRIDMIRRLKAEGPGKPTEQVIMDNLEEIENRYGKIASVKRYMLKYGEMIDA